MIIKKYPTVFDTPVISVDGIHNFLEQFRGKILFFVNTTGHCGNSRQWPMIDNILSEYKKQGLEIIYTPTNDYCGSVTFDEYKNGITKGKISADYAFEKYGIVDNFTDLVSTRNEVWEAKNLLYNWDTQSWDDIVALPDLSMEQMPRSPLYQFLIPDPNKEILCGNFHKFITNRAGQPVALFHNGALGDSAYKNVAYVGDVETEVNNLKAVLDEIILTDKCTDTRYSYDPYNNIEPSWISSKERIDQ